MHELVRTLKEELPKAFRQEAFDKEKSRLTEKYNSRAQELNAQFGALAREKGFVVQSGSRGSIYFIPIVNGKLLQRPEDVASLSETERRDVESRQQELNVEMERLARNQQEIMREMEQDIQLIERHFCESLLTPIIKRMEEKLKNEEVNAYLAEVKAHVLDNLDDFKEVPAASMALPFMPAPRERDPFLEYEVNVVVDNAKAEGAPIIIESAPTYLNLFGTVERVVDRFGRVVTNFTRIKSGSYLRAHGGYLIFSLEDALTEPAVWKVLKRTLRSGRIEMETYEPFAIFSASGLRPEPVKVNTKVIVVGSASSTELYALLSRLANVPLRQDIAVTGSVNQWGEVQAMGGVNEKIEGFYDVCRIAGLTGKQGVLIPESNVRHLVLRGDVIQAVAEGKFRIYPVRTIDDGLAILTSMPANGCANERDVNHAVSERLKELALGLKEFAASGRDGATEPKP